MRTLILLRHAKAADVQASGDFVRPLADRGRIAAPLMGNYMRKNGLLPERIMVSSASRTRETFALVRAAADLCEPTYHDELYLAPVAALRQMIRTTPQHTKSLMIVAHNPGLADLTQRLADPEESDMKILRRAGAQFPTCSLVVFSILTPWGEVEPGDGALLKFITPGDLGGVDED